MKKLFLTLMIVAVLGTACANPGAIGPTPLPTETPTTVPPTDVPPTPVSEADLMARGAAMEALAKILGLAMDEIKFISLEAVDWSDSCLGIVYINAICAAVITPGYRIVLEADGVQYIYHTNADGTLAVAAQTAGQPISEEVQRAVRQIWANAFGADYTTSVVVSATSVEWPDSCLGVAQPGMACLEVITPGALVILKANGMTYEYHTNADGSVVVPATIALTWHREGGLAGFCDNLVVYLAGEVLASTCAGDLTRGNLTVDELAQLHQWVAALRPVVLDRSDAPPGSADAMTIELTLNGVGAVETAEADQQALTTWAQAVYVRVTTEAVES